MNECWDNELSWPNEATTQPTQVPTLAEAADLFGELLATAAHYNWMGSDLLDRTAYFMRRIQAHQPEAEAWFNVGAGEQVDTSAECE